MPRNPRRTIAVVASIIVVLGLVAVVAYVAGRGDRGTPARQPTPTHATNAPSGPMESRVQTPRQPQDGLPRGSAIAGTGGRTKGPDGLPLGYPHNGAGAVTAATNYLMWLNSIRITDKPDTDAMAGAAAADRATRTELIHSADQLRTGMHGLTADQLQPARGAYALAHFSANRATVYIWAPEVITDTAGTTNHVWGIDAVRVSWTNGDWKVEGELVASTGAAAADPADPAGDPSSAEKRSILSRLPADPGKITDSADQSWFEYANAAH